MRLFRFYSYFYDKEIYTGLSKSIFNHLINMRLLALALFFLFSIQASGNDGEIVAGDTIVKMQGFVYDTLTSPTEKIGINAKILLESLPHGNEVGIITSSDSGYYEYYINISSTYHITIQTDRHRKYTEVFDPRSFFKNGDFSRDFYMELQLKENQVIRLNKLIFEQGKAFITPASYTELNRLHSIMEEHPNMEIQLEGHTDYRGSKKLNLELSQQRVDAVKAYLVGKGINTKQIKTKAYGGTQPLIKEQSMEASELNRRVEVRILKLD
jgi:outer membrane protein OmpA-like peptidoglycan-associated protein